MRRQVSPTVAAAIAKVKQRISTEVFMAIWSKKLRVRPRKLGCSSWLTLALARIRTPTITTIVAT